MSTVTKPILLDETGQDIADSISSVAAAIVSGQLAPETVSGSTPSIVAEAGKRYICGECTSLSFTPPASGMTDVIFESGSTATVLTLPQSGVMMPDGFETEADKLYEINFLDGIGVVQAWSTST